MAVSFKKCRSLWLAVAVLLVSLFGSSASAQSFDVSLEGGQEVPPVATPATGRASISIAADKTVSGSIITRDLPGKSAHIHAGAPGVNGPVIIPFVKTGENEWRVADGAKLSDAQYEAYKAGNLYINVHTDAHPGGEIRGQLTPR